MGKQASKGKAGWIICKSDRKEEEEAAENLLCLGCFFFLY